MRSARMEILDEQHIIALLVVDEFIDELLCHHETEAARPKTLFLADHRVANEIAGRAVDRSVPKLFEQEALTRILDAAHDSTTSAEEGDFHMLGGVKLTAMLHGVKKNFPESVNDGVTISFGKSRLSHSSKELDQTICRDAIATNHQTNPIRRRGENFHAVIPTA